jgi:ubiquitin-activating enzyme E1
LLDTVILTTVQDKEGLVTCLDETRHGLEDGDFVTFSEVEGMTELNNCEPRKVAVKGPYTFSIGDTSGFENYKSGGIFTQVKMPTIIDFVSSSSRRLRTTANLWTLLRNPYGKH